MSGLSMKRWICCAVIFESQSSQVAQTNTLPNPTEVSLYLKDPFHPLDPPPPPPIIHYSISDLTLCTYYGLFKVFFSFLNLLHHPTLLFL